MAGEHVTVGIVGGGVAGLTLAKMLGMAGISYKLFESYKDIAPNAGASLGLMPNGLRIFDQLGLIDKIEAWSVPHVHWEHRDGETGRMYLQTAAMSTFPKVFGYGGFFMARKDVLQLLYDSIDDKSPISTSKHVIAIRKSDAGNCEFVEAADGSHFTCDFVAGADGVRSIVRGLIAERQSVTPCSTFLQAQTTCVFGTSKPLPQITPGRFYAIYRHGVSALVFSGLNGQLFWFFFQELERPLVYGPRYRFTDADMDKVYQQIAGTRVTDDVLISDVWEKREIAVMTALEEGISEVWASQRLLLLGDSAHKMVPHAAMGANQAMESAAGFVNSLRRLQSERGSLENISADEADKTTAAYALTRQSRVEAIFKTAAMVCRTQLRMHPAAEAFIGSLPNAKDADQLSNAVKSMSEAERLEDWPFGSSRVEFYTENSKRVLDILTTTGSVKAAVGAHGAS